MYDGQPLPVCAVKLFCYTLLQTCELFFSHINDKGAKKNLSSPRSVLFITKQNQDAELGCTRGKLLRQLQGLKIAYFTNKYLSIWSHMKAIVMPFHMMHGNMIYSKRLQSDRPKR